MCVCVWGGDINIICRSDPYRALRGEKGVSMLSDEILGGRDSC